MHPYTKNNTDLKGDVSVPGVEGQAGVALRQTLLLVAAAAPARLFARRHALAVGEAQ